MPLQNLNAFLGAAFLGVVGAAGMFLVEHYRQERIRHAMAKDLARLDQELSQVRRELDAVLKKSSQRSRRSRSKKANSIVSSSTADDYLSATNLDSSDLEFYDLSDENEDATNLNDVIKQIDESLDSGDLKLQQDTLSKLSDLCIEYPQNVELLWRIGKAHKKILDHSDDKDLIKEHCTKGIEATTSALAITNDNSDVHKWHAILIGTRTEFQSINDKINDGYLFKKHVIKALELRPNDGVLHHMLGMFDYQVAGMKWYERKVAAALYSEPPNSTYDEALHHFLEADRLVSYEWKTNKLMVAKCLIAKGDYKDGIAWLDKAAAVVAKNPSETDAKEDSEIESLLRKYNSYR